MTTYILRRLLLLIPTLLGITLLTYILVRASPGNAALIRGGGPMGSHAMTAEAREQMIHLLGLDKNPIVAYGDWLWRLLHLDLGQSFVDPPPVADKIRERLPLTLVLMGSSLVLSYLIAIPLGIAAAIKRGQVLDRTISPVVFSLYSIPSFAMALMLIL